MSEKNEAPRGKPSVIRKKASATRPSPVSAEMAANLKASDNNFDDGATMVSTDLPGLLATPHPHAAKDPEAVPTPTPIGDYDPKNLSAARQPAPTPAVAKTLRKTPSVVKASELAVQGDA